MEFALLALLAALALRSKGAAEGGAAPPPPPTTRAGANSGDGINFGQLGGAAIGAGVAIAGAVGGGGTAAAGASTAGGTAATVGGLSAGPVVGFIVAVATVIAATVIMIMQLSQDAFLLRHGAFGYLQEHLVKLGSAAAEKQRLRLIEAGMEPNKARALGLLAGFAVAVGYNRAAWAWIKNGAAREVVLGVGVSVVGITPEFRHEAMWVQRAYGVPDEPGWIYEPKAPPPPKPAGFQGTWPPPPPLLEGTPWHKTLEFYLFQGVGTTRAQCLAVAGADWTQELEQACDFLGRASRCSFSLHNKLEQGGQVAAIIDTAATVRRYVEMGMIGLPLVPALGVKPVMHPPGASAAVVDSAKMYVKQHQGRFAWFFGESIQFGVVPIRELNP